VSTSPNFAFSSVLKSVAKKYTTPHAAKKPVIRS
jgi:hypothetical protein